MKQISLCRTGTGFECGLEERVLGRAVIGRYVHQHAQTHAVRGFEQLLKILHGAEHRIDAAVVTDVIPLIHLRRRLERREPDAVHTNGSDIRQAGGQPDKVTHSVTIAVRERPRIHLVHDCVPPPTLSSGQKEGH